MKNGEGYRDPTAGAAFCDFDQRDTDYEALLREINRETYG